MACAAPPLAVDVHFFVVTIEEREHLTNDCTTNNPGPQNTLGEFIQCSDLSTDESTQKFFKMPPPDYTTGFTQDTNFGDHAIIGHGIPACLETPAAPPPPSSA